MSNYFSNPYTPHNLGDRSKPKLLTCANCSTPLTKTEVLERPFPTEDGFDIDLIVNVCAECDAKIDFFVSSHIWSSIEELVSEKMMPDACMSCLKPMSITELIHLSFTIPIKEGNNKLSLVQISCCSPCAITAIELIEEGLWSSTSSVDTVEKTNETP